MGVGLAELLLLLTLGGPSLPLSHSQPMIWLGGAMMRAAVPAAMWVRVDAVPAGPVGINPPPPVAPGPMKTR